MVSARYPLMILLPDPYFDIYILAVLPRIQIHLQPQIPPNKKAVSGRIRDGPPAKQPKYPLPEIGILHRWRFPQSIIFRGGVPSTNSVYKHIYICMCIYIYIYLYLNMYISICVYVRVYKYMCVYTCIIYIIRVCVCILIWIY